MKTLSANIVHLLSSVCLVTSSNFGLKLQVVMVMMKHCGGGIFIGTSCIDRSKKTWSEIEKNIIRLDNYTKQMIGTFDSG